MHTHQLTQICIGYDSNEFAPVTRNTIDTGAFAREEAHLQETVLKLCPADLWHHGSYASGCPRPVLVERHHQVQMRTLHEALTAAITDIVQRWWSDTEARFPGRMPLEAEEEELLQVRRLLLPAVNRTKCEN